MTLLLTAAFVVAVVGLVWAESRGDPARRVWKIAATATFLLIAVDGYDSLTWSPWIMAGLVLSAIGDVALIGRSRGPFLMGLSAFLLAHLAYAGGFLVAGPDWIAAGSVAVALAVAFGFVARWLLPHTGDLRGPVIAYMVVISAMVALAAGVAIEGAPAATFPAAALFYVSDLSVARDRFVDARHRQPGVGSPGVLPGPVSVRLAGLTGQTFPVRRSPNQAPASASRNASPPPATIRDGLKMNHEYGVNTVRMNMKATDANAATAGSMSRLPGDTRPTRKPPMRKLTTWRIPWSVKPRAIER